MNEDIKMTMTIANTKALDGAMRIFDMCERDDRNWGIQDTDPVIAGGAVRDMLLQRPIKDVDVFIPIYPAMLLPVALGLIRTIENNGYGYVSEKGLYPRSEYSHLGYAGRPELLGHIPAKLDTGDGYSSVDFVFIDRRVAYKAEDIVRTFDSNLCQAWVTRSNGRWAPRTTPEFTAGVLMKELRFYGHIPSRIGHVVRMVDKFPNYSLVIEDESLRAQYESWSQDQERDAV